MQIIQIGLYVEIKKKGDWMQMADRKSEIHQYSFISILLCKCLQIWKYGEIYVTMWQCVCVQRGSVQHTTPSHYGTIELTKCEWSKINRRNIKMLKHKQWQQTKHDANGTYEIANNIFPNTMFIARRAHKYNYEKLRFFNYS